MAPANEPRKCYDCGQVTSDWVMESRCTGGESHGLYPSRSYSQVPIHNDRRMCQQIRAVQQREDAIKSARHSVEWKRQQLAEAEEYLRKVLAGEQ